MYDVNPNRDYATEMRNLINQMTEGGEYQAAIVARNLVMRLEVEDPKLLHGWLLVHAPDFVRGLIVRRDSAARTSNRIHAARNRFTEATEAFKQGDPKPLMQTRFLSEVYVIEGGNRVTLHEMTGKDLTFAAKDFGVRAKTHAMQAAFLRALAKKVGDRKVGDVFSEDKLAELWLSIS